MTESPDLSRLPGYITYLKQWRLPFLRIGFVWSATTHFCAFAILFFWLSWSGEPEVRQIRLREWESPQQLFLHDIPVILEGGGGRTGLEAPPGPGIGEVAVEIPPLAIPVPVADDLVAPDATIVTQDKADLAGLMPDEHADTTGGGGGGGAGGSGGGFGGGVGGGVGKGFGSFQTPPRPVKIVIPGYPESMGKEEKKVLFLILVDESGNVVENRIIESSRSTVLDRIAEEAVRKSLFIPAKQNGRFIKAWTRYEVTFGRRN